jgi:N-acetylglucosamine kinase-like BadF-type ATPase
MQNDYVLGVDGGKSKTVCLLADTEGQLVGWGRAGNSDKYTVPLEQALDEVALCVEQALEQGSIKVEHVAAGCFGLAGADWKEDFQELEAGLMLKGLAHKVLVKNDAQIALRANAESGTGVVVSAGTHLAAAIRTPEGKEWFSAWYSTEGTGGANIGHRALWAVLQAYDGRGEATILTDLLLADRNMSHPSDFLRALSAGEIDEDYLASLAPLVFAAHYHHADPVAAQIIIACGKDISRWITGLLKRFELSGKSIPAILTGGLFKSEGNLLMDVINMETHFKEPKLELKFARVEPVIGALYYAYEMIGIPISSELQKQVERNSPDPDFFNTASHQITINV